MKQINSKSISRLLAFLILIVLIIRGIENFHQIGETIALVKENFAGQNIAGLKQLTPIWYYLGGLILAFASIRTLVFSSIKKGITFKIFHRLGALGAIAVCVLILLVINGFMYGQIMVTESEQFFLAILTLSVWLLQDVYMCLSVMEEKMDELDEAISQ